MFKNVGYKIQAFAKFVFIIGIIAAVVYAVLMILGAFGIGETAMGLIYVFYGLIGLVLIPLASWINALFIYGFGQLIINTNKSEN